MFTYKFDHAQRYYHIDPTVPINAVVNLWTTSFPHIHTHEFWEILLVLEGSLINILDGENRPMQKYDMCLIKKENIHHIINQTKEQPKYFNIMIREDYLEQLALFISPDFFNDISTNQYKTLTLQSFENIVNIINESFSTPLSNLKKKQKLLQIAVTKLLAEFAIKNEQPDNSIIQRVINIMSNPDNMGLTIRDIADKVGYSIEYVIRLFKKNNLDSPNKVFTKIKLDYACELLATTDYKTATISEILGINNANYFNVLFKKNFGISPFAYRKKLILEQKQ